MAQWGINVGTFNYDQFFDPMGTDCNDCFGKGDLQENVSIALLIMFFFCSMVFNCRFFFLGIDNILSNVPSLFWRKIQM